MLQTYTKQERNMYLLGRMGQSMLYSLITTGLSYYLQSVIFLPAIAISVIFTTDGVWDTVKDPIMGVIVDRTQTKWGKCRPYLLFAPPVICVLTILTFVNGIYSSSNTTAINVLIIAWAAVSYFLWGMAYTAGDVPFWGILSLMTQKESDRSRLLSMGQIAGSIGVGVIMLAIVPLAQYIGGIFSQRTGDNTKGLQSGVLLLAVILAVVGAILFQLAGLFVKERVTPQHREDKLSLRESLAAMWNCKPMRQILLAGFLRSPASLIDITQITLLSYYFGDNGRTPYMQYLLLLGAAGMIGQALGTLLTPKLAEKVEKRKLHRICSITAAAALLGGFALYLIAPDRLNQPLCLAALTLLFLVMPACMGAINVLQSMMIAGAIDYEEYHTGRRPDGVFFSAQTLLVKLSSGVAALLTGIVYAVVGFSGDNVRAVNDALHAGASFKADPAFATYRTSMFLLFTVLPAIGSLLSTLPLRRYALPDREHARILTALNQKRTQAQPSAD